MEDLLDMYENCAGIDVHKNNLTACAAGASARRSAKDVRRANESIEGSLDLALKVLDSRVECTKSFSGGGVDARDCHMPRFDTVGRQKAT